MKKFIYLFIAIISLTSCSNNDDDDSTSPSIDLVVGEWEQVLITINGEEFSSNCDENDSFEFFEDGTYTLGVFDEITTGGDCIVQNYQGIWSNTEGAYSLSITPQGPVTAVAAFSSNNTVVNFTVESDGNVNIITCNRI